MNLAKGSELGGGILLADQHGVGFLGLRVHQVIEDGVAADMGRKHHLLYENDGKCNIFDRKSHQNSQNKMIK